MSESDNEEKTPDQGKTGQKTLGKRTSLHQEEMPKKINGTEGEAVITRPTLRIGYKVKTPANKITIDDYDAWFNAVECSDHEIKPLKLREEEYRQIKAECLAAIDSGNINVPNVPVVNNGVIDLEDYIKEIQEADKEWAMKYSIWSLKLCIGLSSKGK